MSIRIEDFSTDAELYTLLDVRYLKLDCFNDPLTGVLAGVGFMDSRTTLDTDLAILTAGNAAVDGIFWHDPSAPVGNTMYWKINNVSYLRLFSDLVIFDKPMSFQSAIKFSGDSSTGILTMEGIKSGGEHEKLTLNLDSTANTAIFNTTTGITTVDWSALNLTTTGTISNLADNSKHIFGLGSDASIYYDGTDLIFDSQEVGTGDFLFKNGDLTNPQPSGASGIEGERFGRGALDGLTTGNGNTAFGFNALTDVTNGADNVAIGSSAAANVIGGGGNVALGTSALFNCTTGNNNMAIGKTALQNNVSGGANVAVGESALQTTTGTGNIGIGASTIVTPITSNYSIMIGYAANATAANQCVIGSNNAEITQFYLGNGVTYSNPQDTTLNATGGSGTNIAGADLGIAGGKGTGSGVAGEILFQISTAEASGTTLQTLVTKGRFTRTGFVVGSGEAGVDYTLTVDGETNDGLITWMEDEDTFYSADKWLFQDKIAFTQTDGNEYIDSLNDGYIDIGATTGIRLLQNTVVTGTLQGVTQAEFDTLTDDSMADALHRHSELSATDGTPDQQMLIDAAGNMQYVGLTETMFFRRTGLDFSFNRNPDTGVMSSAAGHGYQFHHTASITPASDSLEIQVYDEAGTVTEATALAIDGNGNIGLGTRTPDQTLQVVGTSRFGEDTTNYSEFEADGTLEFNGTATVWNDMQFQVSDAKVTPASLLPTWEAFTTNTSEYAFSVNDEVDTSANEIPHSWKQGTAGHAHMHITTKAVPAQEQKAQFTVTFAYADTNEVWVEAPLTAELTIPIATTALTNFYLDLGDLTLTNYLIEAQIRCRVKRVAKSAGGTEYVGDIFITQVGVHFEEDTVGSRTETEK